MHKFPRAMRNSGPSRSGFMASRGSDDDDPSDGQAAMQDRIMSMLMGFGPPGSGINARGQIAGLPPGADPNELFYKNELASQPDGVLIDTIHAEWADDYDRLEINHGYIQWLFPVFESAGMNWESQPLTKAGAAAIRADAAASERVIRSYKMMLRFYGFKLNDERTGDISRDEPHHAEQLRLFNSRPHNFLRISRILTSLGELGFVR